MRRLIVRSAVAAACLLLPVCAVAEQPSDRGQGNADRKEPQQGKGAGRAAPAEAQHGPPARDQAGRNPNPAPGGKLPGGDRGRQSPPPAAQPPQPRQPPPAASQAQPRPPRPPQPAAPRPDRTPPADRMDRGRPAPAESRPVPNPPNLPRPPDVPGRTSPRPEPGGASQIHGAGRDQAGAQAERPMAQGRARDLGPQGLRPGGAPSLGVWQAPRARPERGQAGQQWRQQHQNWDRDANWRRNSNWWRDENSFRMFTGLRMGFFFVPDRGYIALPSRYHDRRWSAGDYLPAWFRTYTVRDYARYGLPRPPMGCVWVWLNGDVALIDPTDGYILDVARNVW